MGLQSYAFANEPREPSSKTSSSKGVHTCKPPDTTSETPHGRDGRTQPNMRTQHPRTLHGPDTQNQHRDPHNTAPISGPTTRSQHTEPTHGPNRWTQHTDPAHRHHHLGTVDRPPRANPPTGLAPASGYVLRQLNSCASLSAAKEIELKKQNQNLRKLWGQPS